MGLGMEFASLIPPAEEDGYWMADASCIGVDTEMFFVERGQNKPPMIMKMCNSCPVKNECREYAVKYVLDGIWGGTTPKDRSRLRTSRQKITLSQG